MIYIDNNSDMIYFPRTKSIVDKLICINQISKTQIEIPVLEITGKYYVVDFGDYIQYFENGQYDYVFKNEDEEVLSGILQFGEYNSISNTNYDVDIEFIQYTPSEIN